MPADLSATQKIFFRLITAKERVEVAQLREKADDQDAGEAGGEHEQQMHETSSRRFG